MNPLESEDKHSGTDMAIQKEEGGFVDPGQHVPGPKKIQGSVISEDPRVVHFKDFVTPEEVKHIIELCEARWEQSKTSKGKVSDLHGPKKDSESSYGEETIGSTRTSYSVHLKFEESLVVERIAARVAAVAGSTIDYVEPLVALRYEPGQFFKIHHDGAMRPSTVFVYLNGLDEGAGGTTHFPHLGFEVQPVACTAVMWHNRQEDGSADYRLMHEAKPVVEGVKYGMNCFVNLNEQRDTSGIVIVPVRPDDPDEGVCTS